jgi:hypothetical protein
VHQGFLLSTSRIGLSPASAIPPTRFGFVLQNLLPRSTAVNGDQYVAQSRRAGTVLFHAIDR